jgi:F-type H+-transporting ATPase subunit b
MLDFSVTLVITIVNLVVLFFIMRAILFKPVTKFMNERTMKIQESIDRAEKDKSQAKALLQKYKDQLDSVKAEAAGLISEARENARMEADRIAAEARVQAEQLMERTRKQLAAEQQAAMALFRSQAATLVLSAAGRLLKRELTQEDSRRQAALLLEEFGAGNNRAGGS